MTLGTITIIIITTIIEILWLRFIIKSIYDNNHYSHPFVALMFIIITIINLILLLYLIGYAFDYIINLNIWNYKLF